MDTERDAVEYDSMDFSEANLAFALRAAELAPASGRVLDLGTGTARIPILFLQHAGAGIQVHATDLSTEMLKIGRRNAAQAGYSGRIMLSVADAKDLPFTDGEFLMVMSNSLVHHIPDPQRAFHELARVLLPGGALLLRDLRRPDSVAELNALVDRYAGNADEHQRKLYRDSLHASLTVAEVELLVRGAGLAEARIVCPSDRHWSVERMGRQR
jgi:ubiquinone/menaquinone biosynthesis C-methylase UbiE